MSGSKMPALPVTLIAENLRKILIEGGDENFVIFNGDPARNYYVQFAGANGGEDLYGEAVGNRFLSPPNQIDESQLEQRGWAHGEAGNFAREWTIQSDDDLESIAELVVDAFVSVYGLTRDVDIQVELNLE